MITVHRTSAITGISHSMELDITCEQIRRFEAGEKIHIVFPNLTADQREFLLSGITPGEWRQYIGDNEASDTLKP